MFSYFKKRKARKLAEQAFIDSLDMGRYGPRKCPAPQNFSWLHDPDDFGPLPPTPDFDVVGEVILDAYYRKSRARREAAEQIDAMIVGWGKPPEERELMIQDRARSLANAEEIADWESRRERKRVHNENVQHAELLEAIERGNVLGNAVDFSNKHPFLSGVAGAVIAHKLKKK